MKTLMVGNDGADRVCEELLRACRDVVVVVISKRHKGDQLRLATKMYGSAAVALAAGILSSICLIGIIHDGNKTYSFLLQHHVRQTDAARLMQVTFKKGL